MTGRSAGVKRFVMISPHDSDTDSVRLKVLAPPSPPPTPQLQDLAPPHTHPPVLPPAEKSPPRGGSGIPPLTHPPPLPVTTPSHSSETLHPSSPPHLKHCLCPHTHSSITPNPGQIQAGGHPGGGNPVSESKLRRSHETFSVSAPHSPCRHHASRGVVPTRRRREHRVDNRQQGRLEAEELRV